MIKAKEIGVMKRQGSLRKSCDVLRDCRYNMRQLSALDVNNLTGRSVNSSLEPSSNHKALEGSIL